jgi:hypothetical protein
VAVVDADARRVSVPEGVEVALLVALRVGGGVSVSDGVEVGAADSGTVGVTEGDAPGDSVADGDAEDEPSESEGGAAGPRTHTLRLGELRLKPPAR